jgi:hypothetical protein
MNRLVHTTAIALVLHSVAMSSFADAGGGTPTPKTATPSGAGTSIAPSPAPVKTRVTSWSGGPPTGIGNISTLVSSKGLN